MDGQSGGHLQGKRQGQGLQSVAMVEVETLSQQIDRASAGQKNPHLPYGCLPPLCGVTDSHGGGLPPAHQRGASVG